MENKNLTYKKDFFCKIGLHDWYKGNFSYPVWGRAERHCLTCNKKQHLTYVNGKQKWTTFEI